MPSLRRVYAGPELPGPQGDPTWKARYQQWREDAMPREGWWSVWCDASHHGGWSQLGIHIVRPDGSRRSYVYRCGPLRDNTEAEALALARGVEIALSQGGRRVRLFTDHQGLALQLEGAAQGRVCGARRLVERLRARLQCFPEVRIHWVPRKQNWGADWLSRIGLTRRLRAWWSTRSTHHELEG